MPDTRVWFDPQSQERNGRWRKALDVATGKLPERQRSATWWDRIRARLHAFHLQRPAPQGLPQRAADLLAPPSWDEREAWQLLRPRLLADCVGQRAVIESLDIAIRACRERGEPLDHVLLHGQPGLGKTTFARVIARELGGQFRETSGLKLSRVADFVAILMGMEEGDVLCIEAVHHLSTDVADLLCQVLAESTVDIVFGKEAPRRVYRSRVPNCTVLGTATCLGAVPRRLRDHFGLCFQLGLYSTDDMAILLRRAASLLAIDADDDAVRMIAERSRGTPRVAYRLLRRIRDYAQVRGAGRVNSEDAAAALRLEGIDDLGLTAWDRAVLTTLVRQYRGGPVAVGTLLGPLRREERGPADSIEQYLLASGLIAGTPRGVVATEKAYQHLGCAPP